MTYKIVRINDEVSVESNLSKEEADKRIIFYDTEEQPHRVVDENHNALLKEMFKPEALGKIRRKVKKDDHLMTLADFVEDVKTGGLIDYDGHGSYSDGINVFDEDVEPSDVLGGRLKSQYTHVVWFNK